MTQMIKTILPVLASAILLSCGSAEQSQVLDPNVTQLDIFHFYSEGVAIQPHLVEQGKRFERENPQYAIKWTWGGSESMQKIRARINAGNPPDAALTADSDLTILARENVILPLDQYLAGKNYEGDAAWRETFWPGVLQNSFVEDGARGAHYYGIPWSSHVSGIYYNKGLFEEKGYQIPATWDELFALCDEIQSGLEISCFAADNANVYNARPHFYLITRLLGNDLLYDTAMEKEGTSWSGNPGFLQAARMAQKLVSRYYIPGWEGNQWPVGQIDWANGGAAMIFMPTWLPSELFDAKAEDFVMDIFPVPRIAGASGNDEVAEIKYNGWFIPIQAARAEGAIHFLKFLTSREMQGENVKNGVMPPAVRGVPLPTEVEGIQALLEGKNSMRFAAGLDADAAEWLQKVFFPLNDQLLLNQLTPEQFIARLQEEHDAFYAMRQTQP